MSPCTLSFGNPGSYTLFSINACYLAPKSSFLLSPFQPSLYLVYMCVCGPAFVLVFCFYKFFRMCFSLSTFDLYATFCGLGLPLQAFCPLAKFLALSCTFAHISLIGKHAFSWEFSCAFALIAFCGKPRKNERICQGNEGGEGLERGAFRALFPSACST